MKEIWSESIREEIVGALWLILATLLWIGHAHWILWGLCMIHGLLSEVMAIVYDWK